MKGRGLLRFPGRACAEECCGADPLTMNNRIIDGGCECDTRGTRGEESFFRFVFFRQNSRTRESFGGASCARDVTLLSGRRARESRPRRKIGKYTAERDLIARAAIIDAANGERTTRSGGKRARETIQLRHLEVDKY